MASCIPVRMAPHVPPPCTTIKMDLDAADRHLTSRPSTSPSIPLADVVMANENWRGKNDPAERRRIQNRLNQRAFRQRQRAGESPKQYKPRVSSDSSSSQRNESSDEAESPGSEHSTPVSRPVASMSRSVATYSSTPTSTQPAGRTDAATGQLWDELGQLIKRNFLSAAVANAQHLAINLPALQSGALTRVTRPRSTQHIPTALKPVDLQYQLPHDPIIDTIPHATLRFNILRAIATRQLDAAAFSRSIRASGSLEQVNGTWQRGGVVVWSSPESPASWELSEPFVRRWAFLLAGCEDLIAATNAWRSRRGERLFPTAVA